MSRGDGASTDQVSEQRYRSRPRQAEAADPTGQRLQEAEDSLRNDHGLRGHARAAQGAGVGLQHHASSSAPSVSASLPWPKPPNLLASGSSSKQPDRPADTPERLRVLSPADCNRAVALATTNVAAIATALRTSCASAGSSPRFVRRGAPIAAVLVVAERHVADQLAKDLSTAQIDALDELLRPKEGTAISILAWACQPSTAPGHRALARIVEQLACLSAVGLKLFVAEGVRSTWYAAAERWCRNRCWPSGAARLATHQSDRRLPVRC